MGLGYYPHHLFLEKEEDSIQLPDGTWSMANPKSKWLSFCREQVNVKGHLIHGVDGEQVIFDSLIHLPNEIAYEIQVGDQLSVTNDREGLKLRIKGRCLRITTGLLHTRLWL